MWSASPGRFGGLFAQFRFDLELIILAVFLLGMIVGGTVLVVKARHWRTENSPTLSVEEQLQGFQVLVERGEMDAEEFKRLKAHLEQQAATPSPSSTDGPGT